MLSESKKKRKSKRKLYEFKKEFYNMAQKVLNIPYILKIIK